MKYKCNFYQFAFGFNKINFSKKHLFMFDLQEFVALFQPQFFNSSL
jgi:hypothetical protein